MGIPQPEVMAFPGPHDGEVTQATVAPGPDGYANATRMLAHKTPIKLTQQHVKHFHQIRLWSEHIFTMSPVYIPGSALI